MTLCSLLLFRTGLNLEIFFPTPYSHPALHEEGQDFVRISSSENVMTLCLSTKELIAMVNKTLRNNKPVSCCQIWAISVVLLLEEINFFSQFRALFCIILQLETFVLSHSLFI